LTAAAAAAGTVTAGLLVVAVVAVEGVAGVALPLPNNPNNPPLLAEEGVLLTAGVLAALAVVVEAGVRGATFTTGRSSVFVTLVDDVEVAAVVVEGDGTDSFLFPPPRNPNNPPPPLGVATVASFFTAAVTVGATGLTGVVTTGFTAAAGLADKTTGVGTVVVEALAVVLAVVVVVAGVDEEEPKKLNNPPEGDVGVTLGEAGVEVTVVFTAGETVVAAGLVVVTGATFATVFCTEGGGGGGVVTVSFFGAGVSSFC
jgi:hypothetical protein